MAESLTQSGARRIECSGQRTATILRNGTTVHFYNPNAPVKTQVKKFVLEAYKLTEKGLRRRVRKWVYKGQPISVSGQLIYS